MPTDLQSIRVESVETYGSEMASKIGLLMPFLNEKFTDEPIAEQKLRPIIEETSFEQIIAVREERIIGSAVLSLRRGNVNRGVKGWLEDFVVHPDAQGTGTADKIADYWESWFREKGVNVLNFTSGWDREKAHRFYLRRGAIILNNHHEDSSAFFLYPIPEVV